MIKQLYTSCLAQGAYYISDGGEAAIIDPLRETKPYLGMLDTNGDKLKYIFETHFHADFVSGHVDLARETGATIVFGPKAETSYESHIAKDGEVFRVGRLTLEVLHTPGHTLESTCYLLKDHDGKAICLFTGDTLFIGDVGRPDLAIENGLTTRDLAGMLYDSLRSKIMPLPDDVIVYPAHGAGSACGKNISKETSDTLGNQKRTNYALTTKSREEFIDQLTTGIMPAPYYFASNASMNKSGYESVDNVVSKGLSALEPAAFEARMKRPATVVLDVRSAEEFAEGHIPGSLFIGLDGQFAPWVGTIITDINSTVLLVSPQGREEEAVMRLSRVGYDHCGGYLSGGIEAWKRAGYAIATVDGITAEAFVTARKEKAQILDVRKPGEFESAHLRAATNVPLDLINVWDMTLSPEKTYYVHCAGGYRSMIAISVLRAKGITKVTDVKGGFSAISKVKSAQAEIVSDAVKA